MEPRDALSSAAQIAVALAGFAGVVVAFRSSSLHEWSALDKYRLWLLLSSALIPLFSCLLGMLLLTIEPIPGSIWRWCSGCSFLFIFAFVFFSRQRQSEIEPRHMKQLGTYRYLYYVIASLGTVVVLWQAYNAVISGVFWMFYAAIVFQLAIGILQFARMILLPPRVTHD
jgi:hypothetical protein